MAGRSELVQQVDVLRFPRATQNAPGQSISGLRSIINKSRCPPLQTHRFVMVSRQAHMVASRLDRCFCSAISIPAPIMRLLSAALVLTLAATGCAAAAGPQPVDIPSGDLKLHTQLYKPDGNGPFPTVIGLHACGGLSSNDGVLPRY